MTLSTDEWLVYGRKAIASQPFSQLLGTEVLTLGAGTVELALNVTDTLKQQNGFVHGGVLSYLADNALTFAGGTAMQTPVVTSEYKVNYLRPAIGQRLIVRANAVHTGKSQSVCRCEVYVVNEGQEKLCAIGQGTIVGLAKPT
jgi:uncharacterized protein (TIGR00369 family)